MRSRTTGGRSSSSRSFPDAVISGQPLLVALVDPARSHSQMCGVTTGFVGRGGANPACCAVFRRHTLRSRPRMSWFRVVAGRLQYQGRITRAPFTKWTTTREGASVVARVAGGIRFSLFGRAGAARRRIWRALDGAVRTDSVSAAMTAEAQRYMQALATLSSLGRAAARPHRSAPAGTPAAGDGHRTRAGGAVQAPGRYARAACTRRGGAELLSRPGDCRNGRRLAEGGPSPKHPVQAHDEWACVGVSKGLVWVDPIWAGADGTGHVFMYEFPRPGMPRPKPRELTAAIGEMSAGVSSLSRLQRFALVRAAAAR